MTTVSNINNLKNTRTYLVGAMDRVHDGGTTWRAKISQHLEQMGIVILDPCKKIINKKISEQTARQTIDFYKETEQYDKIKNEFSVIRCADLRCVDISDFIIAHIDIDVHACGSYEEIATANRQKKPVLVWCEQGKKRAPNWLFFMLPHEHIFGSMEEIITYLQQVDRLENTQELERWFFFSEVHHK